ncbi:Carbonic AnHydrase [Chamberlinius hualienensis]
MSDELHLHNYNTTAHRIVLANNGRTAVVHMFGSHKSPYLRLQSRKMKFGLDSFHFHWGSQDKNGSEHSIDNKRFPMEMHLVHVNQKYETLEVAREHPDGIAVIAIFFQISERPNKKYEKLIKFLSKVQIEGEHVDVRNRFPLDTLLPSEMDAIYAYRGSLTTPPCSEAVTWFVIDAPVAISSDQLIAFRKLRTSVKPLSNNTAEIQLVDNFRPQQELHQRLIFKMKGILNS